MKVYEWCSMCVQFALRSFGEVPLRSQAYIMLVVYFLVTQSILQVSACELLSVFLSLLTVLLVNII